MKYSHLKRIIQESGLSPEQLAGSLGVSNMTLRRWSKEPGSKELPVASSRTIIEGLHQLVSQGKLSATSEVVQEVLADSTSQSFNAVLSSMGVQDQNDEISYEENTRMALFQIGSNREHRIQVDAGEERLLWFKKRGSEWKTNVSELVRIVRDKSFPLMEKMIAYGALFYLISPMDLVPEALPFAGLVDDYGILMLASAYYIAKVPRPGKSQKP